MVLKKLISVLLFSMVCLSACAAPETEDKDAVVGVIIVFESFAPIVDGLQAGMASYGYVAGENLTLLYDGPLGTLDGVETAVQRFIDLEVDAIVTVNTQPTQMAKALTAGSGIPVLFGVTDPVGAGIVESMAQPGGNMTGIATGFAEDIRLEWLLRAVPNIATVYAPYNPADNSATLTLALIQEAAAELDVTIIAPAVQSEEDVLQSIADIPEQVDAIFLLPDVLVSTQDARWNEIALEKKLPLSTAASPPDETGELLAYGFTTAQAGEQMGRMLVQVLEGKAPADLPVEPVKFFLGVNLITAEAIGVELPEGMIGAADTIIDE